MAEPWDREMERAVIGCMLLSREAAVEAQALLSPEDFYSYDNRTVFETLAELQKQEKVTDVVMLKGALEQKGVFEKIGGAAYLVETVGCVSTSVHLKSYAQALQEKSYFRRQIARAKEILTAAYAQDKDKVRKLSAEQKGDVVKTQAMTAIPDVLGNYLQELEQRRQSGQVFAGISTGFQDLDYYIGGLQKGHLTILAARPAMGKTALALDILRHGAKSLGAGEMALFFSLEMDKNSISARMFSGEMQVDNSLFSIRSGDDGEWRQLMQEIQQQGANFERQTGQIFVDDTAGLTLEELFAKCYQQQALTGKQIGLVVVDYIQIMGGKASENRATDVAYLSMGLKKLAKELCCPVVALSQLNRDCEKRPDKKPKLADLRESGAIEQDADVVLLLHREKYYFPDTEKGNLAEVIVAKNRHGATGTVRLTFLETCTSFRNNAW